MMPKHSPATLRGDYASGSQASPEAWDWQRPRHLSDYGSGSLPQKAVSAPQETVRSLAREDSVEAFTQAFLTRKGFAPESTTVALYAWLRHRNDFPKTIEACVRAGGDTDTVAFVAGSLAGISTDPEDMPASWKEQLCDWPIHQKLLTAVATALRDHTRNAPIYPLWPLNLIRNVCFLLIVLIHGFRRLFPPY